MELSYIKKKGEMILFVFLAALRLTLSANPLCVL